MVSTCYTVNLTILEKDTINEKETKKNEKYTFFLLW